MVRVHFEVDAADRSEDEAAILHQIGVDVPRTAPGVDFVRGAVAQRVLERVLFIRAVRSAASGYVQGMNDLLVPFLAVFLAEAAGASSAEGISAGLEAAPPGAVADAEADCYWALCKLLDRIQTHYTFAQPGIQEKLFAMGALVRRVDGRLGDHLVAEGLDYIQFAFRWVNCLLQREMPFGLCARLWDTYLAEGDEFADYLLYLLAAFLLHWSDTLRGLEFQDLVMFLQNLPTSSWGERELETILAKAHLLRSSFKGAGNHLL